MARKLNKTVIGIMVVVGMIFIAGGGFVLVANLPGQDPSVYLADAAKFEEEGKFVDARKMFWRAYSKDPAKNPEYLVGMARCYLGEGQIGEALSALLTARTKNTSLVSALKLETEIQFELARMMPQVGAQWQRLLEAAQRLVDVEGKSALGEHALGSAYINLGTGDDSDREKGEAALKEAIKLDPANAEIMKTFVSNSYRRAMALEKDGSAALASEIKAEADLVLKAVIDKCESAGAHDQLEDARLFRAALNMQTGKVDEGVAELEALVSAKPARADVYLALAEHHLGQGDSHRPQAEELCRKAIEAAPKDGRAYWLLGQLLALRGQLDEESKVYTQGLQEIAYSPHFRALKDQQHRAQLMGGLCKLGLRRAIAAKGSERDKALESAQHWIDELSKEQNADSLHVLLLKAHLANVRGDVKEATILAEKADKLASGEALYELKKLMGGLYDAQGQWGSARDALLQAVRLRPFDVSLYTMLGRVYLRLGQSAEALRYLQPAEPEKIRDQLGANPDAIRLSMEAYKELGQMDKVRVLLAQLELLAPNKTATGESSGAGGDIRSASLLYYEEKYDEAEKLARQLIERGESLPQAARLVAMCYQAQERMADAKSFLEALSAEHPDDVELLKLVFSLSMEGDYDADERRLKELLPKIKDEKDRIWMAYNWYVAREKFKEARPYLDSLETSMPTNAEVVNAQFHVALRMKDWDRAQKYAARSAELNTDGTHGKISYGRIEAAKGDHTRAIALMAAGLAEDGGFPNYSLGHVYLAESYMATERVEDAKRSLRRALDIDPTNGFAHRALARLAYIEQDEAALKRHLKAAVRSMPEEPWVKGMSAWLNERENPEEGIKIREKERAKNPGDVNNLVLLADLYVQIGNYDKAAEIYREALDTGTEDIRVVARVTDFYCNPEVHRPEEGEQVLTALFNRQKDNQGKALSAVSLGRFYESQKMPAKAEERFGEAVQLADTAITLGHAARFYQRTHRPALAMEYYERVLGTPNLAERIEADSRSQLISISLGMQDLARAKKEVDAYVARLPDDPYGAVHMAAYHIEGGDIEKATDALRAVLEKHPDFTLALWQRGRLYRLRERWQLALDDLEKAKLLDPNAFGYMHRVDLAWVLVETGRVDQAVSELSSILDEAPEQFSVVSELCNIYLRAKRPEDAERLATKYQRRYERQPEWPRLLGQLAALEQDWDNAIRNFELAAELTRYNPQDVAALFSAMRRANRPQPMIDFAKTKVSQRGLEESPRVLADLGWAYKQVGDEQTSLDTYDRALDAAETDFAVHSQIIMELTSMYEVGRILERAEKEAAAHPDSVNKKKRLLHVLYLADKSDEALQVASDLISMINQASTGGASRKSDLFFAHMAKATFLSELERYAEAKTEYEAALAIDDKYVFALNNLAYLLVDNLNNPQEALPYAEKAAQLSPRDANILHTYGLTLLRNGNIGEAETMLRRAIQLDRQAYVASFHLGQLHMQRGEYDAALERLEIARATIDELSKASKRGAVDRLAGQILPKIIETIEECKRLKNQG